MKSAAAKTYISRRVIETYKLERQKKQQAQQIVSQGQDAEEEEKKEVGEVRADMPVLSDAPILEEVKLERRNSFDELDEDDLEGDLNLSDGEEEGEEEGIGGGGGCRRQIFKEQCEARRVQEEEEEGVS